MGRYDEDIAGAKEAIAESGQLVTWRQIPKVDNPDEPWKSNAGVPIDRQVSIVFLPVDRVGTQLFRQLAGTDLITGNVYGLMGAVPFKPSPSDTVIRDGEELRISTIDVLAPNGDPILYTVQFEA